MAQSEIRETLSENEIVLEGVRTHNLKNLVVRIPKGKITVVTGPSGSGKSSLAFDTIYAEGQRRYIESLSAYVRQFLERMERPDVDSIRGISPTVAIEQRRLSRNPRSTIATMTEIYDYLRLLYGRAGTVVCLNCRIPVIKFTPQSILNFINNRLKNRRLYIFFDFKNNDYRRNVQELKRRGFYRFAELEKPGEVIDANTASFAPLGDFLVLADRVVAHDSDERITEACEQGFLNGAGSIYVYDVDAREVHKFSSRLECSNCGRSYLEPEPRLFSFNNPYGACPECQGFGTVIGYDWNKAVANPFLSVLEGGISLVSAPAFDIYRRSLLKAASKGKIRLDIPINKLTEDEFNFLIKGDKEFIGLYGFVKNLEKKSRSFSVRYFLDKYRGYVVCHSCNGGRLRPEAAAVQIDGKNLPGVVAMTVDRARKFFELVQLEGEHAVIAAQVLDEIRKRIGYLYEIGLGYLTLDRLSSTLSGGEAQRVNLSTSLASTLVATTYILDEPSIGLHPRDMDRLVSILKNLRSYQNTVIVVEHDAEMMRNADHVIDLGPGSGALGGEIMYEGPFAGLLKSKTSITGKYLRGEKEIPLPKRRKPVDKFIHVRGANLHNLVNVDVDIPLYSFVCITGVSGSGKSTLVYDILYDALKEEFSTDHFRNSSENVKLSSNSAKEIVFDYFPQSVELVDQSAVGRISRSNVATYSGAFDPVREIFARTPLARERGLNASYFSFNVDWGGRCEACNGEGVQVVEMQFLADVSLECEVCRGKRYGSEALEIKYKGKSIADILDLTVAEAKEFFSESTSPGKDNKDVLKRLTLLDRVGLSYLKLGQRLSTLSGGEAQRLKISSYLSPYAVNKDSLGKYIAGSSGSEVLFILDEPTTGLHFEEIAKLLEVLFDLRNHGNSIIVVEHNLDVIKCADYVIDLGPEAGEAGGKVVAAGTPEEIIGVKESRTGPVLRKVIGK
ncbi:MAG TPA: excinuclease ABC subunit UvrA [Candidatus Acidoferrales bacterium]|nr:excinuclease ABC subunit UvrA [Candidatus Acidoferrales bacterium]